MQRFLAIQTKRIGDLILTAPALQLLKRRAPNAEITLVTLGAAGDLAQCIPGVSRHLNYHRRRPNLDVWSGILTGRYDCALDFNGTDRAAFMSLLSGASVRAAYAKRAQVFWRRRVFSHTSDASLTRLHTIDHMIALLEAVGIEPGTETVPLRLEVPTRVAQAAREKLVAAGTDLEKRYAVIHPGTARREKYWMPDRWAAVADHLRKAHGLQVVLTGVPSGFEQRQLQTLLKAAAEPIVNLAGQLSLAEMASVVAEARLALGVDTAAMHLAAAAETPQIILYGPINPYQWRPLHQDARILLAGTERALYHDADFAPKVPLFSMDRISVSLVLQTADDLMSRPAQRKPSPARKGSRASTSG